MSIKLTGTGQTATKTGLTIPATTTLMLLYRPHGALSAQQAIARLGSAGGAQTFSLRADDPAVGNIRFTDAAGGELAQSGAAVVNGQWNIIAGCVDAGDTGKLLVSVNGQAWQAGNDIGGDATGCDRVSAEGNAAAAIDIAEMLVIDGKVSEAALAAMYAAIGDYGPNLTGLTQIFRDRLLTVALATMTLGGTPTDVTGDASHPYDLIPPANFQARKLQEQGQRVATRTYVDGLIAGLSSVYAPIAKGVEQHSDLIGDGEATEIAVTHNLNSDALMVEAWDVSTKVQLFPAMVQTSANVLTLTFDEAPASEGVRVVIWKRTG